MGRVAWHKVLRDLWLARGRTATLVVATAIGLTAVGGVLGAYSILFREMPRSFLSSNPAAATLVAHGELEPALLEEIRQRQDIGDAERRGMVLARVEIAPEAWLPLRLFVIEDVSAMRVEAVALRDGAWPPPQGAMLIERTSKDLLGTQVGASLLVSPEGGQLRPLQVAGVVFDGGVAPAWQEQTALGYITPATLAYLGIPTDLDLLKITVSEEPLNAPAIRQTAQDLAAWLETRGIRIDEIRIPPPGLHPHQGLMNALALVLLLFGLLALGLSALLVATMVSAILARHVRQIGAMKAIGAQQTQVGLMYGAMVLAIGGAAALLAILPGVVAGRELAGVYAGLSNVELDSLAIAPWVFAVVVLAGLLTPLLAAAGPVVAASRMTVREAITDVGMYEAPSATSTGALVARIGRALGPTLVLALRQVLRRRSHLGLSLVLMAFGGGAFISGLNVAAASESQLAKGIATLGYDLEINLGRPQTMENLLELVRGVPDVSYAEPVGFATVAPVQPGEAPVTGTYKDGGHGTVRLYALTADSHFQPAVESGRWLEPGDLDAIVVAPSVLRQLGVDLGGTLSLSIDGRISAWRVVGVLPVARVPFGPAASFYVSDSGFARATGTPAGSTKAVRIITAAHDPAAQTSTSRALERVLATEGIGVTAVVQADWLGNVLRGHMAIVQAVLEALGVVLGLVGALSLASAMSLSVVERTREFGVMLALGATPARVIWSVVAEALLIGGSSWLAAVLLALVLSTLVGTTVGGAILGGPLPLVVSPLAILSWLAVVLLGSALAGGFPARAASRLTIRETLVYA